MAETVGGVTTNYLVDTNNLTGYAQVIEELQNGNVVRRYAYGLERINETQTVNGTVTTSFYGYDGHGSVRQLFSSTGAVTDTYDYDAFGNLISSTGTTPNNYLFAGEQFDPALGLYYNRARYLNANTGRFWEMDTEEGSDEDPVSLHKYLYASANPVNETDPSGHLVETEVGAETIEQGEDYELAQLYREVGRQIGQQLVRRGLILYSGIAAFFIASVIPNPNPSPTQTKQDEDEETDATWLYRTGNTTSPSAPRVLGYNRQVGQTFDIQPEPSGMVLGHLPWPDGASTNRYSEQLTGNLWRIQKGAVYSQPGLDVIADGSDATPPGPRGIGHHTIFPVVPMSPEAFVNAVLALPWVYAGKRK